MVPTYFFLLLTKKEMNSQEFRGIDLSLCLLVIVAHGQKCKMSGHYTLGEVGLNLEHELDQK